MSWLLSVLQIVLLRVHGMSNNAGGNKRLIFPGIQYSSALLPSFPGSPLDECRNHSLGVMPESSDTHPQVTLSQKRALAQEI